MKMKWFHFLSGSKKEERTDAKSALFRFYSNTSTEYGSKKCSSEFSSPTVSVMNICSTEMPPHPSFPQRPSNLKIFTYQELRGATRNFSRSMMIGEGGFGCVYRGTIKNFDNLQGKLEIAVKKLNLQGPQGYKEWLAEINVLGVADHPNLVKLVGYGAEDDERGIQRFLVYEFIPNKSVEDHLSFKSPTTLSWSTRLKIALDAACGLTYLHEGMEFQIIFRDFKTSNILLDEEWNAKLSDFGMARHGPPEGLSHVSTDVVGTLGYLAPEYMRTGRLNAKSDVWSYGVVLYELITGCPPIDCNRPKGEQKLLEWIKPYISDPKRFRLILDPRLDGQHSIKSAIKLSAIANKCLLRRPKSRPKMSEVLEMVHMIVDAADATGPPPQHPLLAYPSTRLVEDTRESMKEGLTNEGKRRRLSLRRRVSQLKAKVGWFAWRL